MMRSLLFLVLFPTFLQAQEAYIGIRAGRNVAQLPQDRTRSGPTLSVFTEIGVSEHVGVGWEVSWLRAAVADDRPPSGATSPGIAEPEYLTTDLVGRLSWSTTHLAPFHLRLGATVVGGGWLGLRTGGSVTETALARTDFGQLWGVSCFATHRAVKLELGIRAYHGEQAVWESGPRQQGSLIFIGVGVRIHRSGR